MKRVYIGIDAHKETNTVAFAFEGNAPPQIYGKVSADLDRFLVALRTVQKKYEVEKTDIALCYEAGPTGFVLARRLLKLGYACIVVAPSKIPSASGDRIKADRRDARNLARLLTTQLTGDGEATAEPSYGSVAGSLFWYKYSGSKSN